MFFENFWIRQDFDWYENDETNLISFFSENVEPDQISTYDKNDKNDVMIMVLGVSGNGTFPRFFSNRLFSTFSKFGHII